MTTAQPMALGPLGLLDRRVLLDREHLPELLHSREDHLGGIKALQPFFAPDSSFAVSFFRFVNGTSNDIGCALRAVASSSTARFAATRRDS